MERLAERLAGEPFDAVHSSDLSRARDTARFALPGCDPVVDARLREIHLGRFEGRLRGDLPPEDRSELGRWIVGPYHLGVGGGESSDDVAARVRAWLGDLPRAGRVAVFSHGGTIGALVHLFVGRPPLPPGETVGLRFSFENTSITRVAIARDFVTLLAVNDTGHLTGLGGD